MPPEKVGKAHSEVPHRPHEEKIAFPNMKSTNGFGLIHTPVHDYNKIPEAREAVTKEFVKLERYLLGTSTKSGNVRM